MHFRFIFREMYYSRGQAFIYLLCVALSLVSIVALNSFKRDIYDALMSDARKLHGGDIILKSHQPFSEQLDEELEKISDRIDITSTRTLEFYSVIRRQDGKRSLLSNIKAVDNTYPLYGSVSLRSGQKLAGVLRSGKAVVAPDLLKRLGVQIGESVLVGNISVQIVDVVAGESQRPVDFFNFGPRVFVSALDLEEMGLVQYGSRIHFEALVRIEKGELLEPTRLSLLEKSTGGQVRVTTSTTAESRVKRFLDNLLFFLSLISLFTLFLAGIGMQSGIAALIRRREKSMAVLKAVGASEKFLVSHYLVMIFFLSLAGCFLGVIGGLILKLCLPWIFEGLIPGNISFSVSSYDLVEGIGLGLIVAAFFTYLPLLSIRSLKPAALFRQERHNTVPKGRMLILILAGALFLFLLLFRQLEDLKTGLYFLGSFFCLFGIIFIVANFALFLLSRMRKMPLSLRQAVRSLMRPGNSTRSVVVTLAAALAVLLGIELVENDLHRTYISSYPEDAPNLFCLDIQKNQKEGFSTIVGGDVELFPVIRARLKAINNKKINRSKEKKRRGDRLSREFNLTYRDQLLADEMLTAGETLFGLGNDQSQTGENVLVPVSVLDSVAAIGSMRIGDTLSFNIQGVPMEARVTSIRSRTESMLYPFFYFVFPVDVLKSAPHTFFAALHIPVESISDMENTIVNSFPNISTINVSLAAKEIGVLMGKLSGIIDFFALFSICAGSFILISSILATRLSRMREGVYYKIMGGGSVFVTKVFFIENLLLALVGGGTAILVAQVASWGLCRFVFDIGHDFNGIACLYALCTAVLLVTGLGMASSIPILREKPATFLSQM